MPVKVVAEPKVGRLLRWVDLGPFVSLQARPLASLLKSVANIQVNILAACVNLFA